MTSFFRFGRKETVSIPKISSLDEDLAETLTKIVGAKHVPSRTEWLREKVVEQAKTIP